MPHSTLLIGDATIVFRISSGRSLTVRTTSGGAARAVHDKAACGASAGPFITQTFAVNIASSVIVRPPAIIDYLSVHASTFVDVRAFCAPPAAAVVICGRAVVVHSLSVPPSTTFSVHTFCAPRSTAVGVHSLSIATTATVAVQPSSTCSTEVIAVQLLRV